MIISVYSERTRLKKLMMMKVIMIIIIIIMNKSQEMTVFRSQKLTFAVNETKARKVMVHFKFDNL